VWILDVVAILVAGTLAIHLDSSTVDWRLEALVVLLGALLASNFLRLTGAYRFRHFSDLGAAIGRQHAHDVVYDAAQAAFVEGKSFSDLLAADARLTAHMDKKAIAKLLDPTAYTGLCADMARESVMRARGAAAALAKSM